jgi:hypothetical protein
MDRYQFNNNNNNNNNNYNNSNAVKAARIIKNYPGSPE